MCERIRKERRYHDVVNLVLLSPQLVVSDHGIHLHKELLKRVVDLSLYHPSLYHGQNGSRNLLQNPTYKLLGRGASIQHITVNS